MAGQTTGFLPPNAFLFFKDYTDLSKQFLDNPEEYRKTSVQALEYNGHYSQISVSTAQG
jgi:adenine-specific DNA methylase